MLRHRRSHVATSRIVLQTLAAYERSAYVFLSR